MSASGWSKAIAGHAQWASDTCSLGVFYKDIASAGTTGACAVTLGFATEGEAMSAAGRMIILQPAAGGGGGVIRPRATWIM